MIYILGFDPSKYTGWALYSPDRRKADGNFSHIQCGVFEMPKNADMYYLADQLGLKVTALVRRIKAEFGIKPDFAVLEHQIEAQVSMQGRGQSFSGSITPWVASSAIVSTLSNHGIPYATLMPSAWRPAFFGEQFDPPQLPVMETVIVDGQKVRRQARNKKGSLKFKDDWKSAAITKCEEMGIELPKQKALADDAAEACALAICGQSDKSKIHAGRYEEAWKAIRNTKFKAEQVAA